MAATITGYVRDASGNLLMELSKTFLASLTTAKTWAYLETQPYQYDHVNGVQISTPSKAMPMVLNTRGDKVTLEDGYLVHEMLFYASAPQNAAIIKSILLMENATALPMEIQNKVTMYGNFERPIYIVPSQYTTLTIQLQHKTPVSDLVIKDMRYNNGGERTRYLFWHHRMNLGKTDVQAGDGSFFNNPTLVGLTLEQVRERILAKPTLVDDFAGHKNATGFSHKITMTRPPTAANRDIGLNTQVMLAAGVGGSNVGVKVLTNGQWVLILETSLIKTNNDAVRAIFQHEVKG